MTEFELIVKENLDVALLSFDDWYAKIGWEVCCHPSHSKEKYHTDRAAIESTKEKQFGCHIGCGNPYPDCVIDTGDIAECGTAMDLDSLGKTKIDCEYWKVIEG